MIMRYFVVYDEGYGCNMIKAPDGDFVLYDDHVKKMNEHDRTKCPNCENCIINLREDKLRLEKENEELKKQIRNLHNTLERIVQ